MWQHLGFRFEDRDRVKDKPAETTEQMALWDLCPGIEQFPNSRRGNGNSGKIEDTFSFPRVKSILAPLPISPYLDFRFLFGFL
jgi:hypothetical protein